MKPLHVLGLAVLVQGQLWSQAEQNLVLGNGIQVTFVPVPSLKRQTTVLLLPLSHLSDAEGGAQTAHLLEHMMRRSTDPTGSAVGGIQMGGYTKLDHVLLYSIAPTDQWEASLLKHAAWLRPEEWELGVLERETASIEDELRFAASEPHDSHAYGLAAWSQTARFGSREIDMRAALGSMGEQDIPGRIESLAPIGAGIRMYCMGPAPIDEQTRVLRREFETLSRSSVDSSRASGGLVKSPPEEASWNLDWRHLVIWYPLELKEPWHRLAAALVVERLNFRFSQHTEDEVSNGKAQAFLTELEPGQPIALVLVYLEPEARARDAEQIIAKEIQDLPKSRGISFRDQLAPLLPDPEGAGPGTIGEAIARMQGFMSPAQIAEREAKGSYMEWGMLMSQLEQERMYGGTGAQVSRIALEINVNDLEKFPKKMLPKKRRHELLLGPAEKQ